MKGHAGGGSAWQFGASGLGCVVRADMPFHVLNMLYAFFVQERLLEMLLLVWRIPRWVGDGHEHESLILAQNERWRHA